MGEKNKQKKRKKRKKEERKKRKKKKKEKQIFFSPNWKKIIKIYENESWGVMGE